MPAPALSVRRKLVFAAIITAVVVALLLGVLEAALRLAGYGYSPHFVRRATVSGGEVVWRENRWCTAPYFSPELVRRPQPFRLAEKKPLGTFRIFVLGSSAAMGDPDASFSFARVLEAMLRAAYPEQRFEVINAAITAVNSHVVRGIAEDCARLEPDLFIVYEGHNEVIGPFGPAGVFAPFFRNAVVLHGAIALKGTRTGQLFAAAGRAVSSRGTAAPEWGGMQMFLQQHITADDPRLDAMHAHFRSNLAAIIAASQRAGATTLLCTVLTNQRDFAPFLSRHRTGLSAVDRERWDRHFAAAERATQRGDVAAAEAEYRAALALDDHHAELLFRLGRLALQTGRDDEAQRFLQLALDLDALRFRADSNLNAIIRSFAATESHSLRVIDLADRLARRSAHGVVGDDLLYEHVHLTFRGAYEVARELFPAVIAELSRRGQVDGRAAVPFNFDEARMRLGYTAHEQAMISLELLRRFRAPPFTAQSDNRLRVQTWAARSEKISTLLARPEALPAQREHYQRAIALAPDDWILARNVGMMLASRGAVADARPLLERAASWIDDDVDTLLALATTYRTLGDTARVENTLHTARRLEPRHPELNQASTRAKP